MPFGCQNVSKGLPSTHGSRSSVWSCDVAGGSSEGGLMSKKGRGELSSCRVVKRCALVKMRSKARA